MSIEQFTRGFCLPRDCAVDGVSVNSTNFESIIEDAISKSDDLINNSDDPINKFAKSVIGRRTLKAAVQNLKGSDEAYGDGDLISESYNGRDLINDIAKVLNRESTYKKQENLEDIPEDLTGIAGHAVRCAFKQSLIRKGEVSAEFLRFSGTFVNQDQYRNKLCGKLKDFVFLDEGRDEQGRVVGSGHLSADVFEEEYFTTDSFLACRPDRVTLIHWDITVPSRLYVVHDRSDKNFPDAPFPSISPEVKFPDYATDPGDARSIWCRGLNKKLYASGSEIKISHVYRQICEIDSDGKEVIGCLELIDKDHRDYGLYYPTTDRTCVDIMFKGEIPTTELPPQPEYCMGRCEEPAIINSGGG